MVFVDIGHEAVFSTPGAQRYLNRMTMILRTIGGAAQIGLVRALRFRGLPEPSTALPLMPAQRQAAGSRAARPGGFRAAVEECASVKRIAEAMSGLDTPGLLGDVPVAVLSHGIRFPGVFAVLEVNHQEGQEQLAALSTNSVLIVAEKSSHAIPWDEPEVVIDAIRRVAIAARNHTPLDNRIPALRPMDRPHVD
jgi:pimeloyl-ACP methyl ester carboxylesterase